MMIFTQGCKSQTRKFQDCFCPYFCKHFAALYGNAQACVIYLSKLAIYLKAPSYSPYLSKRGPHKGSPSRSGQADQLS